VEVRSVKLEIDVEHDRPLGGRLQDLLQEAVDATASAYTEDASTDVEQHLAAELSGRGITAVDDGWLAEAAHQIRSGHHLEISGPDEEETED
jgi:hypothetical protein